MRTAEKRAEKALESSFKRYLDAMDRLIEVAPDGDFRELSIELRRNAKLANMHRSWDFSRDADMAEKLFKAYQHRGSSSSRH